MRHLLTLAVLVLLAGCGVSKNIWLAEVDRREAAEKDLTACVGRATACDKRESTLRGELSDVAALRAEAEGLRDKNRTRADELEGQLAAATAREKGLQVALDNCTANRTELNRERDHLRKTLDDEAKGRAEDRGKCGEILADRDWVRKELEAQKGEAAAARARTEQLATERQALEANLGRAKTDLEAERRGRREEVAALTTKLSSLEGQAAALAEERAKAEKEKAAKVDEVTKGYEELLAGMKSELDKGQVTISQLKDQLTVNVVDEILFASGSATVNPKGMEVLNHVGQVLNDLKDKRIVIEGHTDNVPLRGELTKVYATNWELSAARATSVVRYLQDKAGIDPTRLSAAGYGEYRPLDANDTKEGRARNRRIEIKLVPLESAAR